MASANKLQVVTLTASGVSTPLLMDIHRNPFSVGFGITFPSSGGTALTATEVIAYTVQHTFEDPNSSSFPSAVTWFNHEDVVAATAVADGNYAYPVTAIRFIATTITATTASPTLSLRIIQSGPRGA